MYAVPSILLFSCSRQCTISREATFLARPRPQNLYSKRAEGRTKTVRGPFPRGPVTMSLRHVISYTQVHGGMSGWYGGIAYTMDALRKCDIEIVSVFRNNTILHRLTAACDGRRGGVRACRITSRRRVVRKHGRGAGEGLSREGRYRWRSKRTHARTHDQKIIISPVLNPVQSRRRPLCPPLPPPPPPHPPHPLKAFIVHHLDGFVSSDLTGVGDPWWRARSSLSRVHYCAPACAVVYNHCRPIAATAPVRGIGDTIRCRVYRVTWHLRCGDFVIRNIQNVVTIVYL